MLTHEMQLRVKYADTDKMGVVYYANYAVYYEAGRTELFRSIGVPYSALEAEGIAMPVVSLEVHYRKPAHYDDLLTIRTTLHTPLELKVVIDYEILNADGELLNNGSTTLVFTDMATRRPQRAPQSVVEAVEKSSR